MVSADAAPSPAPLHPCRPRRPLLPSTLRRPRRPRWRLKPADALRSFPSASHFLPLPSPSPLSASSVAPSTSSRFQGISPSLASNTQAFPLAGFRCPLQINQRSRFAIPAFRSLRPTEQRSRWLLRNRRLVFSPILPLPKSRPSLEDESLSAWR